MLRALFLAAAVAATTAPARTPLPAAMRAPAVLVDRPATPGPWPLLLMAPARNAGPDAPLLRRLATGAAGLGYLVVRPEWRFQAHGSEPSADLHAEARQLSALASEWEASPEVAPGRMVLAAKSFGSRVAVRSEALGRAKAFLLLTPNADQQATFDQNYAPLREWGRPLLMIISATDPYGDLAQIRAGHDRMGRRAVLQVLPHGDHDFNLPGSSAMADEAEALALTFLKAQLR